MLKTKQTAEELLDLWVEHSKKSVLVEMGGLSWLKNKVFPCFLSCCKTLQAIH